MKSEESLKAARERAARGYVQPGDPRFVRKAIEDELRELQRQAMEAILAHIGGIEFREADPKSQFHCRGWTVAGEENQVWASGTSTIDELLDGPALEERERQAAAEARGWDTTGGGDE